MSKRLDEIIEKYQNIDDFAELPYPRCIAFPSLYGDLITITEFVDEGILTEEEAIIRIENQVSEYDSLYRKRMHNMAKELPLLEKVINGETIIIYRNKKEVAKLIPPNISNWRNQVKIQPKLLVPPEEIIKPIDDIWQDYI